MHEKVASGKLAAFSSPLGPQILAGRSDFEKVIQKNTFAQLKFKNSSGIYSFNNIGFEDWSISLVV